MVENTRTADMHSGYSYHYWKGEKQALSPQKRLQSFALWLLIFRSTLYNESLAFRAHRLELLGLFACCPYYE